MTLLPASFSAKRRTSDIAFDDERHSDARANLSMSTSASNRNPVDTAAGRGGLARVKDLERLSVSDDGRLYWDDKPVVVRRRVQLSPWQTFGAILIGLAALVIALSGALHITVTAHDWMCRAKWMTGSCPTSPAIPPAPPARLELPN